MSDAEVQATDADKRYRPTRQTLGAPKIRLTATLKVRDERGGEETIQTIATGVFLSWLDLRWWLSTHAVDDLDIDD